MSQPAELSPATPKPKRRFGRRAARRIAVLRDVLASIKDAGIIGIVVALLMFHDEVGGYFAEVLLWRGGEDRMVDVAGSLGRLNRVLDAEPVATGASARSGTLGQKVLRAERRLLRSEDAAFIEDWIVVVATLPDAGKADAAAKELTAASVAATVLQKSGKWRVVAQAGSAEAVQSVLNRVRPRYPRALATTMSSWCPATDCTLVR
jgi:hypothetical protein